MQHPDGWKSKWTRCWNERLLSWVWKKKLKKIKQHTSNTHDHKWKGGSFGAWILHSFTSNQAVLLYLWVKNRNKTNSKARQRESDQTQASLAVFWYSGLVKCISQTLCCQGHPSFVWSRVMTSQAGAQGPFQVYFYPRSWIFLWIHFKPLAAQGSHCRMAAALDS